MVEHSAIYECSVLHHRLTPVEHRFKYRVFYLWLDLDETSKLSTRLWLFSRNSSNVYSFFDSDHLDDGSENLKKRLLRWVESQGQDVSRITSVRLLTFPRVFGHIFNPASFYYCYDAAGEVVCSVVQVTNTFREQKPYLLNAPSQNGVHRLVTAKHFYVSPFSDLGVCFDFKLRPPGETLEIHIDDREAGSRVLLTSLTGHRRLLRDARLLWYVVKYPLLTLRVIFLIHWHAFLLWMKKAPFRRKNANPELQRNLFRPHSVESKKRPWADKHVNNP